MFELIIGGAISYLLFKSFYSRLNQYPHSWLLYLWSIPMLVAYVLTMPSIFSIMWRSPEISFGVLIIALFSLIDLYIARKHHENPSLAWWNYCGKTGYWLLILIIILGMISFFFAFTDNLSSYNILMPALAGLWFIFLECLCQRQRHMTK